MEINSREAFFAAYENFNNIYMKNFELLGNVSW